MEAAGDSFDAVHGSRRSSVSLLGDWAQSSLRAEPWRASYELPRWQAHRGYHASGLTENSLAAVIEVAKQGAMMSEFDVRLTRDNVPVLFHDESLERITGRSGRLDEITLRELRQFHPVSTLEEVLSSRRATKLFNIELKSEEAWNEPLERHVARVIRECEAEHRVLFSSFNPFSLWKMQNYLPQVPRALLVAPDLERQALREMWLAPLLKLHLLHLDQRMVPATGTVIDWHRRGFKLAVWTVNDPQDIQKFWHWEVDSVITDLLPPRLS